MLQKVFDNNLVVICKSKLALKLNKEAHIGMFNLALSKVLMYGFHYYYIKDKYDKKSKLLFTDTDSLMFEFKTENIYEDLSSNKEMLDFSNYSTKSKHYDDSNKLVIGKVKDENGGTLIEEFVDNNEYKKRKKAQIKMLL